MRTITRAIVRSGIEMVYSQGFNPHPRFSLPLPRNVGLASDDELFCVRIEPCPACNDNAAYAELIAPQLPTGFEMVDVELHQKNAAYQPIEVEYIVKADAMSEKTWSFADVQKLNERICSGEKILIERTVNAQGDVKIVDIAVFLKEFDVVGGDVKVACKVLPTGTIRPDEILKLLNIDSSQISSSIVRKKVKWEIN